MTASSSPAVVKFTLGDGDDESTVARSPQNTTVDQANRSLTAFTPIMTPKAGDRSGSMVLLSPSRTISETLTALASQTGAQLEEVWDEVGYSPEDRAGQLSDLLIQIQELCERKIAEERGVAETFHQTIAEAKEEIKQTASALKALVDPYMLNETSGQQTLSDELATLEATLEGLRTAASAAKQDLRECLEYMIEAHDALGHEMDPKWRDIDTDLTAERREQFHRKRDEMKEQLASRMAAVIQLIRDCQHLMSDLKIDEEQNVSDIDRQILGSLVRSKDGSFIMASKFRSESCIGISTTAFDELTARMGELHREKKKRKEQLQEMGGQIAVLWEKLHVPEEEQIAFTESVQGLGMDTIEKGNTELQRLEELKSCMLGKLIQEARGTIAELWEQIDATQDHRLNFAPFNVSSEDLFNDELLEQHENYIGQLQSRLEQMKPILRIIERRETIVRERIEYEELQKDPERLKQRGAAMTRQLMQEEKMARRIKRDLPKLTELLTEKLAEWKENNGEDFQYHGEDYLIVMDRQEEEWNQYKAEELQRKLKKKQEEKTLENPYSTVPPFNRQKKKTRGPLGDAQAANNSRHKMRGRSQDPKKATTRNTQQTRAPAEHA